MKTAPSIAAILGAGLGSRLGERTRDMPKGFLEIGGVPLVVRSVEMLLRAGIDQVVIGTGHHAEVYRSRFEGWPVRLAHSPDYASTGSMRTLAAMLPSLDGDFLLLESDLLYEPRALDVLLRDDRPDIVLASGFTESGDEVWIETDGAGSIVGMSKDPSKLARVDGELVGISRISRRTAQAMVDVLERVHRDAPKLDYESAIVEVSRTTPVPMLRVDDLVWCEIDDETHLERALSRIVPRLKTGDTETSA